MTALLIFLATYLVLALGRFPGLRVDRTGASIIGASLMIGAGVLSFDAAVHAVDHATLVLLFGMMIVVANLRLAGFFRLIAAWVVRHAHRPLTRLAGIVVVAGVFSAFFVNDTICLVLTPLVLEVTLALRRNPVPYLLAVAMASNAGSTATITGNPQNMLIGNLSGISYRAFAAALAPVALAGMAITFLVIAWMYRAEFRDAPRVEVAALNVRVNRFLLWKSLLVTAAMLICFFAGLPVAPVWRSTGRCWRCSPGCSSWWAESSRRTFRRGCLPGRGSSASTISACWPRPRRCCRTWSATSPPCWYSARFWLTPPTLAWPG